jgi:2-iminoacetate synthase
LSFAELLQEWPAERVRKLIDGSTPDDVGRALRRDSRSERDLAALLSPHAIERLEGVASEAHRETRRQFGRTIGLYVPLYLSNVCGSDCTYCGYSVRSGSRLKRRTLSFDELRRECATLAEQGFQNVLLLTGEARTATSVDFIAESASIAREYFPSVSVEIYALEEEDYARLVLCGIEGVTLYMETYHRETYSSVHLYGEKMDYAFRLDAIERAGHSGVRRLSIGALLGLYDWQVDGFWTALHGRYLQKTCWQSALSISFPRLTHVPPRFSIPQLVGDRDLVQLMLALRLFLPEAGFNLSTREDAELRDRLLPLGITMMSAGSSTRPGGYSTYGDETLEQFEIEDRRDARTVVAAIRRAGYDPVWKDFDRGFLGDFAISPAKPPERTP